MFLSTLKMLLSVDPDQYFTVGWEQKLLSNDMTILEVIYLHK